MQNLVARKNNNFSTFTFVYARSSLMNLTMVNKILLSYFYVTTYLLNTLKFLRAPSELFIKLHEFCLNRGMVVAEPDIW